MHCIFGLISVPNNSPNKIREENGTDNGPKKKCNADAGSWRAQKISLYRAPSFREAHSRPQLFFVFLLLAGKTLRSIKFLVILVAHILSCFFFHLNGRPAIKRNLFLYGFFTWDFIGNIPSILPLPIKSLRKKPDLWVVG